MIYTQQGKKDLAKAELRIAKVNIQKHLDKHPYDWRSRLFLLEYEMLLDDGDALSEDWEKLLAEKPSKYALTGFLEDRVKRYTQKFPANQKVVRLQERLAAYLK